MTTAQTNSNNAAPVAPVSENTPRNYPPRFYLYHPNANGTGSALRMSMAPATSDSEGAFFISMAAQSGVAGHNTDGSRQFARFDWMNRTTVKFGVLEVAQILQVIRGCTTSVNGDKGLFHDARSTSTSITFSRVTDPNPGFNLTFCRTSKDGSNSRLRTWFFLRECEAIALEAVLNAAIPVMALGNINERRSFTPDSAYSQNTQPADAPVPF